MRVAIEMPRLSPEMKAGSIVSWTKEVGAEVGAGDVIAEIETEKITVQMEAPVSGTLVEIVHSAGEEVPIGEAIGYVEDGR
jgi:pyruvate dehydrogenase E2 component (dihydrolipoamide acetyltransferase)